MNPKGDWFCRDLPGQHSSGHLQGTLITFGAFLGGLGAPRRLFPTQRGATARCCFFLVSRRVLAQRLVWAAAIAARPSTEIRCSLRGRTCRREDPLALPSLALISAIRDKMPCRSCSAPESNQRTASSWDKPQCKLIHFSFSFFLLGQLWQT